jgi:hypothetical protein
MAAMIPVFSSLGTSCAGATGFTQILPSLDDAAARPGDIGRADDDEMMKGRSL